uniref:CSON012375 protein n=1 Tax=Culicoides sonorensis TaxID=179676 RepID=A0A336M9K1_CULSO
MTVLLLVAVAILWGATNPFIRKGSVGIENIKCDSKIQQTIQEFIFLLTRWQYLLPFILNQSGSVLFVYALTVTELSLAVPVTNSLTFIITAFVSKVLGEEPFTKNGVIGMLFVVAGTILCSISTYNSK